MSTSGEPKRHACKHPACKLNAERLEKVTNLAERLAESNMLLSPDDPDDPSGVCKRGYARAEVGCELQEILGIPEGGVERC